jgi:flavin reductase (DIM6/NTAB) family NADH-FMN oxidoreductase RutF
MDDPVELENAGMRSLSRWAEKSSIQKETGMNMEAKRTGLRMIPYGLYVLTSAVGEERVAAAAVSWVTQASFEPPLVVVCVRVDSFIHGVVEEAGKFALNILGKDQADIAVQFFKQNEPEGMSIGGYRFQLGQSGSPLLDDALAYIECEVKGALKRGDHTVILGQVIGAGVRRPPEGRPDEAILKPADLSGNVFYGG